jgi:hypothetical protein
MVCGEFVFAVLHRRIIPAEKRYKQALAAELSPLRKAVSQALQQLKFDKGSSNSIASNAKTHAAQIVMQTFGPAVKGLEDLDRGLSNLMGQLEGPKKGADGDYELKYLFQNIYTIAASTGGSLKINSHHDR